MLRWRLLVPALVAIVAGCPSTAELSTGVVEPGTSSSSSGDVIPSDDDDDNGSSGTPGGRCKRSNPFGAPVLVEELDSNAPLKASIAVTSDELDIFFLRNDAGGPGGSPTLRRGHRSAPDRKWSVEDATHPTPPAIELSSITRGGSKLYYYVDKGGVDFIHSAPRQGGSAAFGGGTQLSGTAIGPNTGFVVETDDVVYYTNANEVWRATVTPSAFGVDDKRVLLEGRGRPIVNVPQTSMYFTRDKGGEARLVGSHRAGKNDTFELPNEDELAAVPPELATALWVSPDDCVMYVFGPGDHVYETKRRP